MSPRIKALSVHLFTGTGVVFAMLAMLAATEQKWSLMFLWLVIALIVDGIDGPLARRYHVKTMWPTYDGVLLDLIIDYLTYVFIPAFALFKSGLLPGWPGWIAVIVINYASVIYFCDTRMKTKDYSFAGFPACWNMVILVLFALKLSPPVVLFIVVALAITMFTNLKFVHPVRDAARRTGLGCLCRLGRLGRLLAEKLGAQRADRDIALPLPCRNRPADHPRAPATHRLRPGPEGRCPSGPPRSISVKMKGQSRVSATPAAISATDTHFEDDIRSPNTTQPIRTANRIEVSRSAATSGIGAKVIAQTAIA
jgi:phosphatidylcholine synthase